MLSVFQPLFLIPTHAVCTSAMLYGEVEAVTLKVDLFLNVTRISVAQVPLRIAATTSKA
jgi:hypothetical protein